MISYHVSIGSIVYRVCGLDGGGLFMACCCCYLKSSVVLFFWCEERWKGLCDLPWNIILQILWINIFSGPRIPDADFEIVSQFENSGTSTSYLFHDGSPMKDLNPKIWVWSFAKSYIPMGLCGNWLKRREAGTNKVEQSMREKHKQKNVKHLRSFEGKDWTLFRRASLLPFSATCRYSRGTFFVKSSYLLSSFLYDQSYMIAHLHLSSTWSFIWACWEEVILFLLSSGMFLFSIGGCWTML